VEFLTVEIKAAIFDMIGHVRSGVLLHTLLNSPLPPRSPPSS